MGDSLMWAASDQLQSLLRPVDVDVRAVPGLTADDALYELAGVDLARTDALVLSVGTNDALHGATSQELAKIDAVGEKAASVPCVRWMTLTETSPNQAFDEAARRVNDELRAIAARHPGTFGLVPWHNDVAANPQWLSGDGIHHTPDGVQRYAVMMADALQSCAKAP